MSFRERWRAGRERARLANAADAYHRSVDRWLGEVAHVGRRLDQVDGRGEQPAGVAPYRDELLIDAVDGISLVSPKSTRITNYVGASYQLTDRTRLRTGQYRTSSIESPTPIDVGRLAITNRRVIFTGAQRTVTWDWKRLVGTTTDGVVMVLHVGNRSRAQGFMCTQSSRGMGERIEEAMNVGWGLYCGRIEELKADLEGRLARLLAAAPEAPVGIEPDVRVLALASDRGSDTRGVVALIDDFADLARSRQVHVGYCNTNVDIVERALRAAHVVPVRVNVDEISDAISFRDAARSQVERGGAKAWVPTVADDIDGANFILEELWAAPAAVFCGERTFLDVLGITVVDDTSISPVDLNFVAEDVVEIETRLSSRGCNVTRLTVAAAQNLDDVAPTINAAARFARAVDAKPQALVVRGDPESAAKLEGALNAFETVAWCVGGIHGSRPRPVASVIVTDEPDTRQSVAMAPVPLTVAGQRVDDAARVVVSYVEEHGSTVTAYDFAAGTFDTVTPDVIRRTRRPWMNSRISEREASWLCDRAASAPWGSVTLEERLADADPTVTGGLYDRALALYDHFAKDAPKGIGGAKLHKCLYLMRPRLYPILDTHLRRLYDAPARQAASNVSRVRTEFRELKRMYWAAIRNDLLQCGEKLTDLRAALSADENPLVVRASEQLSDIRLLDMCVWRLDEAGDEQGG